MRVILNRSSISMMKDVDFDMEFFDFLFKKGIPFNIVEDGIDQTIFEFETEEDVNIVKKQLTFLKLSYS